MSVLQSPFAQRWLVPAAAGLAVIGGGVAIGVVTAGADSPAGSVAPRSAAELLVDLQTARLDGLSGTVVQRSDLGLPDLSALLPGGATTGNGKQLSAMVNGTHTLRIWYSGPDKSRVAVIDTLGETDVITNGRDVWVWSSKENKARHHTTDGATDRSSPFSSLLPNLGGGSDSGTTITPDQVARLALTALGPSTSVTTTDNAKVAGRDAYELVLSPRDPASLVGSIRLDIDAEHHVPLRLALYARGTDAPAFEAAFTQISFARPDDASFAFNPPPGGTVEEATPSTHPTEQSARPGQAGPDRKNMVVLGAGWSSVIAVRLPSAPPAAVLAALPPVSGAWGSGRLVGGRLFSVLITDDGRLFAGAVSPTRLYEAVADPKAALPR